MDVSIDSDGSTFGQFILQNDYSVKAQEKEKAKEEYVRDNGDCLRKKVEIIMNLDLKF